MRGGFSAISSCEKESRHRRVYDGRHAAVEGRHGGAFHISDGSAIRGVVSRARAGRCALGRVHGDPLPDHAAERQAAVRRAMDAGGVHHGDDVAAQLIDRVLARRGGR
jgi:hypothetical protein